tara:strand:+ start:27311 stop:27610 length:300 start_codon:yes stop_codon:yes gene_type:complete
MKKRLFFLAGTLVVVALVLAAFVWDAAQKEVVFLCPNFQPGVTEQSVIRQLETANLSRFKLVNDSISRRIIFDSAYNFGLYKCIVELNQEHQVIKAHLE